MNELDDSLSLNQKRKKRVVVNLDFKFCGQNSIKQYIKKKTG